MRQVGAVGPPRVLRAPQGIFVIADQHRAMHSICPEPVCEPPGRHRRPDCFRIGHRPAPFQTDLALAKSPGPG